MNERDTAISVDDLRIFLIKVDEISNEQWLSQLNHRKKEELDFHDQHRDRQAAETLDQDVFERLYGNRKYYAATQESSDYVDNWIARESKNRVFLDYACGNGVNAIKAAQAGAELSVGIDISSVSIENARKDAEDSGNSSNTFFVQADAENSKLPDNCIDRVVCSGMLHHLDLSYAFPELRRILKPGGKILAVEALDYNPAIKIYRHFTPSMRTKWETLHILGHKDLRFARHFFEVGQVKYWHIASILTPHMGAFAGALHLLDRALTKIPGVQLMAWIFTFELTKRN